MEWWQLAISPAVMVAVVTIGYRALHGDIVSLRDDIKKLDDRLRDVEQRVARIEGALFRGAPEE